MVYKGPSRLGLADIPDLAFFRKYRHEDFFLQRDFAMIRKKKNIIEQVLVKGQAYRITEGRLLFLLGGYARVAFDLMEYVISTRNIILLPPGTVIELLEVEEESEVAVIAATEDFLNASTSDLWFGSHLSMSCPVFHTETEAEWNRLIDMVDLMWRIVNVKPFRKEVIEYLLKALLYEVRFMQDRTEKIHLQKLSHREVLFRRFIELVNIHCTKQRNVGFYADKLCLTPRYLNTVVRQVSRSSVMDWVNQAVFLEAKILLRNRDLQIAEVADRLHFPNSSFFCKFFKRMAGMTPLVYQRLDVNP